MYGYEKQQIVQEAESIKKHIIFSILLKTIN